MTMEIRELIVRMEVKNSPAGNAGEEESAAADPADVAQSAVEQTMDILEKIKER